MIAADFIVSRTHKASEHMTRPADESAVRRLLYMHGKEITQLTGVSLDGILEIEERLAIEQESSNAEIDIVPRDTTTGELLPRKPREVRA